MLNVCLARISVNVSTSSMMASTHSEKSTITLPLLSDKLRYNDLVLYNKIAFLITQLILYVFDVNNIHIIDFEIFFLIMNIVSIGLC